MLQVSKQLFSGDLHRSTNLCRVSLVTLTGFTACGPFSCPLFPQTSFVRKVDCFVWLLFGVFERLGDEYFSWWYMQHMICSHMAMVLLLLAFAHSIF